LQVGSLAAGSGLSESSSTGYRPPKPIWLPAWAVTMQTSWGPHAAGVPCSAARRAPQPLAFSLTVQWLESLGREVVAEPAATTREPRVVPIQLHSHGW